MKLRTRWPPLRFMLLGIGLLMPLLAVIPSVARTSPSIGWQGASAGGIGAGGTGKSTGGTISGMPQRSSGMASTRGVPGRSTGASGRNTSGGAGTYGSATPKAARKLKKLKMSRASTVPDKYADYNWGAASTYNSASLYAPTWNRPQADYTWGATPP
jgi:hypothetical protein